MDYKALFAAIKAEINARKLQYKQIADLAHLRNQTLHNWFATHPKPEGEKSSKGFIEIVKMLNLNLENFADVSSIGGRIEFLRWKNAMTVSELASKAGIDTTTICNYEANRLNIKTIKKTTVNKFATAFGVTADYILHGDKKEPKNGLVDLQQAPTVQIEMEEVKAVEIDLNNDNLGEFLSHFDFETDISDMVSVIRVHENKVIFGMESNYARYMTDVLFDELKDNFQSCLRYIYANESIVAEIVVINAPVEEPIVENQLTAASVFNFENHNVRTFVDENGEVLFLAKDVCNVLGYANTSQAVSDHCKEKGISKRYTLSKGGKQESVFINEPNLMRLVVKSKLPAAEKFEAWVFEEVLPTIRKTGKYEAPKREVNHLSPEVLTVLRQARTVQVAMGMSKAESRKYANDLIKVKFGFDMSHATTDGLMKQLDFLND